MIKINGKEENIESIKLLDYLKENDYNPSRVAIELNGVIIKRSEIEDIVLNNGDKVEIVCFVGGG